MLRSNIMSTFKSYMRAKSWMLNPAAAVIAALAGVIAFAQEPQKQLPEKPAESAQDNQSESKKKEENVIICDFGIVITTINFLVTGGDNRPIPDLAHDDFAIFEDDARQEIALFEAGPSVSLSLGVDVSDHEPLKFMARQAAWGFLREMRADDYITIPQLKTDQETVRGLAADKQKFENAVNGISSTNKLVAIVAGAFKSETEGRTEGRWTPRDAVVIITDGHSLLGAISPQDEAYAILRQNIPVYFIILDDGRYSPRHDVQSRLRRTRYLLTRIARVSGGLALVVKNENEISDATKRITERLRNQYTVGYYTTNDRRDGSFRNIRVVVTPKDKRKVKVFAPSGYFAVDPEKIR